MHKTIIPSINNISLEKFHSAESIYKIIDHEGALFFGYFELNQKKHFINWFSPDIKVCFKTLEKEDLLLVGIDLKVVVLCNKTGKIVLSLGLFSLFKGFENTNDLTFTIYSELEDIVINKNGLSISQIKSHDLEF